MSPRTASAANEGSFVLPRGSVQCPESCHFGPATLSIASGTFGKILTSGNPRILNSR